MLLPLKIKLNDCVGAEEVLQYWSSFLRSLLIGSLRSCDLALAHTWVYLGQVREWLVLLLANRIRA